MTEYETLIFNGKVIYRVKTSGIAWANLNFPAINLCSLPK